MELNDTAHTILEVAQEFVQTRGYNAFSYRDISERIGIKTSSIHYYFPNKDDLGAAMMRQYRRRAVGELTQLTSDEPRAKQRLARYMALFRDISRSGGRLCPWVMLGADYATLSEQVQSEVRVFCLLHESWLEQTLETGRRAGEFAFHGSGRSTALSVFAALEGALISARVFGDTDRFMVVCRWIDASLANPKSSQQIDRCRSK